MSTPTGVKMTRLVKVTASRTNLALPEFDGILYRARNSPEKDELVLTSEDLAKSDVTGGSIFVEHNWTRGRVGTIVGSEFRDPDYYITGRIDTDNHQAREEIRRQLRTGELNSLSIGMEAQQCERTGRFFGKYFTEASLVRKPYYENCSLVSVRASDNDEGRPVQEKELAPNSREILELLQQKAKDSAAAKNANRQNTGTSDSVHSAPTSDYIIDRDSAVTTPSAHANVDQSNLPTRRHTAIASQKSVVVQSSSSESTSQQMSSNNAQENGSVAENTMKENSAGSPPSPPSSSQREQYQQQTLGSGVSPPSRSGAVASEDSSNDVPEPVGKTPTETSNEWRNYFERTQAAKQAELDSIKSDYERKLSEAQKAVEELDKIKQRQREEYAQSNKDRAQSIAKRIEEASLPEELKEQINVMASDPSFKDAFKLHDHYDRELSAKDQRIAEMAREMRALKRKVSSGPGTTVEGARPVAVASTGSQRPQINNIGGTAGMKSVSYLDLMRSKNSSNTVSSSSSSSAGDATRFGNQSYSSPSSSNPSTASQVKKIPLGSVVPEPQREQYQQQLDAQSDQVLSGDVRDVHRKIFSNCSQPTLEHIAQREHESRGIFKHSLREQGDVGRMLFEQLWAMKDNSNASTVGDEMRPFLGKDLMSSEDWAANTSQWRQRMMN